MTQAGLVLGTAGYMAPEQARGAAVDRRADIWSFGVVLWEMLTGDRLFEEGSVSDTLAAVLKSDIDLEALPADAPPAIHHLVGRCLERNAEMRLRDIGEARIALQDPTSWAIASTRDTRDRQPRSTAVWACVALLALTTSLVVFEILRGSSGTQTVEHFFISTPDIEPSRGIPVFDISPGARSIVWIQNGDLDGTPDRLVHRRLDSPDPIPIAGTEGAKGAVSFMPNGRSVLFVQEGWLKLVSLEGGKPVAITRIDGAASGTAGAAATADGRSLVYGEFIKGPPSIRRVDVAGGDPETILKWEPGQAYAWPSFLPGDRTVLYFAVSETGLGPRPGQGRVEAVRLDTGERAVLLDDASHPTYFDEGRVATLDPDGQLVVFPIDLESLERTGPPTPVASGIRPHLGESYRLTPDGTLGVLRNFFEQLNTLVWVDREGRETPASELERLFTRPRLSPDGTSAMIRIERESNQELWRLDLERDILTPAVQGDLYVYDSVWSPDGSRVAVSSMTDAFTRHQIRVFDPFGGGEPEVIWERVSPSSTVSWIAKSWSSQGKMAIEHFDDELREIFLLADDGKGELQSLPGSSGLDFDPYFSPDGEWIAFTSRRSGSPEIYIQRPRSEVAFQVSRRGGQFAHWSPRGDEIFYVDLEDRLVSVKLDLSRQRPVMSDPAALFSNEDRHSRFAVSPADGRLLMVRNVDPGEARLEITRNLTLELERSARR
jgi:serine/threonine-protein kinase